MLFPEQDFPNARKKVIDNTKKISGIVYLDADTEQAELINGLQNEYFTKEMISEIESLRDNNVFNTFIEIFTTSKATHQKGIPLSRLIKEIGMDKLAENFPKALQLRGWKHGTG